MIIRAFSLHFHQYSWCLHWTELVAMGSHMPRFLSQNPTKQSDSDSMRSSTNDGFLLDSFPRYFAPLSYRVLEGHPDPMPLGESRCLCADPRYHFCSSL